MRHKILPNNFYIKTTYNNKVFIFGWMKIKIKPPPYVVLWSLYGGVNPSKINWFRRNVSSSFVSNISKISVLLPTTSFSISNLFLIELIFKWAIMIWFGFFLRISLNTSFFQRLFRISTIQLIYGRFVCLFSIS